MSTQVDRRHYVQQVLDLYRRAPGTAGPPRPVDRRLASQLHDRGVALDLIYAALLLGIARRTFRPVDAPPLARIATLHYFRPIIDELRETTVDPGYVRYLQHKLATVARDLLAARDHQLS
jgi:hypothetical protein